VLGICALTVAGARPSQAMPGVGHALATDRPALFLAYTKQNPRWEAPGHGARRNFTKPYKPLRQPPENIPPKQQRARHGSEVLNRFVVLTLAGIVVLALGAERLSARLHLPSAWIALLFGLVAGPVAGVLDPDVLLGNLLLPLVSLFFVVLLCENLLHARFSDVGDLGAAVARLVRVETVIIAAGTAVIAAVIGLGVAAAALLAAILMIAQRSAGAAAPRAVGPAGPLLEWEGVFLELAGIALALIVCEVALAEHLYRAGAPAILGVAKTVIGGSLVGVALGNVLTQLLRGGWIAEPSRQPLALVAALTAFALTNLLREGCGFFAVFTLGLYLANQTKVKLVHTRGTSSVPAVLISGLLVVLAARVSLDEVSGMHAGGLTALGLVLLVALLLLARLATWRARLPWRAQLALTGRASTTAIVVTAAAICALRLGEFGEPQADRIVALGVLVVFIRLAVSSVAGVFETRWARAGASQPEVPGQATPAGL
jgi:NhaP-type Na+/H+ or K+/H+ antiporter